ncbi:hypothetical protein G5642_26965 [Citrobacter freundii]|nr:hypothetical protein [Citrobacter freundii]
MSTYLGFALLLLFLAIVTSVYFFSFRRNLKNVEQQLEILGSERKELIEILGCSHYGVGSLIRQLREHCYQRCKTDPPQRLKIDPGVNLLL